MKISNYNIFIILIAIACFFALQSNFYYPKKTNSVDILKYTSDRLLSDDEMFSIKGGCVGGECLLVYYNCDQGCWGGLMSCPIGKHNWGSAITTTEEKVSDGYPIHHYCSEYRCCHGGIIYAECYDCDDEDPKVADYCYE